MALQFQTILLREQCEILARIDNLHCQLTDVREHKPNISTLDPEGVEFVLWDRHRTTNHAEAGTVHAILVMFRVGSKCAARFCAQLWEEGDS